MYVRANEDISLDIYEGETIGIVGESGCGKSTLGRTLLQLYPQTAGTTIYYGKSLYDVAPHYVKETLTHVAKYRAKYEKAKHENEEVEKKVQEVGEDKADFFLLQRRNLARCAEQTALTNIAHILGGFALKDPDNKGRDLNLKIYEESVVRAKTVENINSLKVKGKDAEAAALEKTLDEIDGRINAHLAELNSLKAQHADDPEFQECEALRTDGIDLARLKYSEMRKLRKDLQIIFQDPYSSLNPRFPVGQIIEEGLVTHKMYKHGSEEIKDYIVKTMEECGLQDYMLYRYPHQFSGGQRQRISIARALAVRPKFVVCDECVSALDVSIQLQIINLLLELKKRENLTYMFISHDLSVVRYISDRICVMYLGNVVELTDTKTLFADPRHPYTIALLSSIPTTELDNGEKERIILEGNIPSPIKPPEGCKFHTRCYMACDECKRVPPELREVTPGHFLACHFPDRKVDQSGNYLFELPKMERKSNRVENEENKE
ncbi:MAG: ATP-binding cassette domain-containing protein [Clostridia bacterium]|nr:ATP-binding cassette domain-containing protein [Clostridia bacterium]